MDTDTKPSRRDLFAAILAVPLCGVLVRCARSTAQHTPAEVAAFSKGAARGAGSARVKDVSRGGRRAPRIEPTR